MTRTARRSDILTGRNRRANFLTRSAQKYVALAVTDESGCGG